MLLYSVEIVEGLLKNSSGKKSVACIAIGNSIGSVVKHVMIYKSCASIH